MMCEICHKEPATVFLTQIVNGQKIELHLCEKCAKEQQGALFNNNPSFQKFLSGLLDTAAAQSTTHLHTEEMSCPQCGMTLEEFKKTSKVGCAKCYEVFSEEFSPILKRLHGNVVHGGKRPEKLDAELRLLNRIGELESELKIALMQEAYEEAAKLRDQIKELKKGADLE
ncbi:UvrB/UvrC motif-containing protein [Anaerotalea alkaliphila]|uniref:UVR domain-containing protein n=1 Tax=Anaerotalea alkaliphila TaxID=2662126 RepID=A0A7X5KN19_9FIRM|nr:UvrB/UvrC motif-containing protein [Anaerotalea alkaliphila]NDL67308.1 hypothetical protein [Anaerotalea alkaliphila]